MRCGLVAMGLICALPALGLAQTPSLVESPAALVLESEPVDEVGNAPLSAPVPPSAMPVVETAPADEKGIAAMVQGLKKVTAETSQFEAPVDAPVSFGTLVILVKQCVVMRRGNRQEHAALLSIRDRRADGQELTVFSGWLLASSPSIAALEHPVYDVTLLRCVLAKPSGDPPPPPPAAKKTRRAQ